MLDAHSSLGRSDVLGSRWAIIGSQVVGQLALVAVMPVLTRLVAPEELGAYQVALSICILLQPVATLRIEFALPTIRREAERRRLWRMAWFVIGSMCLGMMAAAGLCAVAGWTDPATVLGCGAILLVGYAGLAMDNAQLIRDGRTTRLTVRNLIGGLGAAGLQLVAAVALPTAFALALAVLLGRGLAIALTRDTQVGSPQLDESEVTEPEWSLTRGVAAVLSGVASSAAVQALVLYASVASGQVTAARMGIAQRSAAAPLGLLSQGLSQSIQAEVAPLVRARDQRLRATLQQQVRALSPLAFAVMVALAVGGPLLAEPIFGEGWGLVGTIVALLSVPSGLQLVFAPISVVYLMMGEERTLLMLHLMRLIGALTLAAVFQRLLGGFLWAVAGFSLVSVVFYLASYLLLLRVVDKRHPSTA